jgi:manganese/iron transport system permease protein
MQRAALEIVLLAPIAGILGAQIVLRGLAFFTHASGTVTFPGLVVAGPIGLPPFACALGVVLAFAAALHRLSRWARIAVDAATALLLIAALAVGIILASDVFESGSEVDQLLFGSLLAIGNEELVLTGIALVLTGLTAALLRRSWIASGFEPASSRALGLPVAVGDWALVSLIAIAAVATLDAVGALLVSAVLVLPAATARLVATSIASLEAAAIGLALLEGVGGLLLAYELDAPPGATIAVLGGLVFVLVAASTSLTRSRRVTP